MAEKQKKPIYKRKWFIVIAALIVIGAIFGPKGKGKKDTPEPAKVENKQEEVKEEPKEKAKEEAKADYEITELAVDESGYTPKATGILKNNTDKDKSYVQITFAVKDKDGNKLGTAIANINNLKAGETWKFEAMSFSTDEGQVIDLDDYEVKGF